ncbi:hypothetical protein [Shimia sediminis]|uniref:hypothetical protein n=1 Tax=Shimia sediminis TaxID=2497945 RepID=UPI000F8DEBC2|nr:hypothetical protein [Shimia sediminis]
MSYDLLVFDPKIAPRDRTDFMSWYGNLTKWEEQRDYNSPIGMTGNLPMFFEQLRQEFPPMNGPFAYEFDQAGPKPASFWQKLFRAKQPSTTPEPFNEALVTDYSLAENAIYMAFAWSVSDQAYNRVFNTALSTGVGFFDVSANNGAILHDAGQFEDLMGL